MDSFFINPIFYDLSDSDEKGYLLELNNDSDLVVLYKSEDITKNGQFLLQNILKAISLSLNKVSLCKILDNHQVQIASVFKQLKAKRILCFGVNSTDIGIMPKLQLYHTYKFEKFKIIFSDSFDKLQLDNLKKKKLWIQLKNNFA